MLGYAAARPVVATRGSSPSTILFIGVAHIVGLAIFVSARPETFRTTSDPPLKVRLIPDDPVEPVEARPPRQLPASPLPVEPQVDLPSPAPPAPPVPFAGPSVPLLDPFPLPAQPPETSLSSPGETRAPQFETPDRLVRPPYPGSRQASGAEGVLRLRLTVAPSGAVTAVDPLGPADPVFLAAARRHLLAHWRYRPALKDGRPVAASVIITLHFQLDG